MQPPAAVRGDERATLAELLEEARRVGVAHVAEGEDIFEIRRAEDTLPEDARCYLMKGGPIR